MSNRALRNCRAYVELAWRRPLTPTITWLKLFGQFSGLRSA
jgi:hypothetical protein